MSNAPFPMNPAMTAVAIRYRNPATTLIADMVLPRVTVPRMEFGYLSYDLAQGFTVPDLAVGRRGTPGQVEFDATRLTDECQDYGLDDTIPQQDIDQAASQRAADGGIGHDPVMAATEYVTDLINLGREVRTAGVVFAAATYPVGNKVQLSGSSQFSHADSDPLGVITTAIEATRVFRPNTLVMGRAVWAKLRLHPKLIAAVFGVGNNAGLLTRQQFADLFELPADRVLIGESFVNTAKKGQNATLSRTWGKHIALLHVNPQATVERGVTFGFTAQYGTRIAGSMTDKDIGIRGGVRVRVGESVKEKVVAPELGYLIQDAVA